MSLLLINRLNLGDSMFIKIFLLIGIFLAFSTSTFARSSKSGHPKGHSSFSKSAHSKKTSHARHSAKVKGNKTKKGSYAQSHQRTKPNKTKRNNWSAKGKVNSHTRKVGSKYTNEH